MLINKIFIENYKSLDKFDLEFNNDLNIIVGDNEVGKSSLLEAINLALTGILNGRNIHYEISPYLFNKNIVDEYIAKLKKKEKVSPPKILLEIYFNPIPEFASLKGTNNTKKEDVPGVALLIEFDEDYKEEYEKYISEPERITTLPTEYYSAKWYGFSFNPITKRSLMVNSVLIDATTIRLQNGTDYYIQKIIDDNLDRKEKTELTLAYRELKQTFGEKETLKNINTKLKDNKGVVSNKDLSVSIDISQKSSWESNLTSYLDDIPFQFIGKGEQNALKILLALEKKATNSNVILIEEPENHLSFSNLNILISKINEKCVGKQVIITTHSTFVMNKLGVEKVILMSDTHKTLSLKSLSIDTQKYFKKLPGYDTLRLLIAKKSILVEGPSEELFIQKAYIDKFGKLPIENGIDVISVRGLSFKRFLEIAKVLGKDVRVVTDNDGDFANNIEKKYADYFLVPSIQICYDKDDACKTLEPQIVKVNDLAIMNKIMGRTCVTKNEIIDYMIKNKTDAALKFFETKETFVIPQYIIDAIS